MAMDGCSYQRRRQTHGDPSPANPASGDLAAAMGRWTGVVHVPLSQGGPLFRVAASLILTPSKALAPAIERLSDAAYLAKVLAGKLAGEANAWVVDAACFAGPFAVYRELVPAVDTVGHPERYDPTGLPAAAGVASILAHCIREG
uniref:Uncharacterized protein n=1 Tax=Aegilops tauschii TaxID=37682 RepID=M8ALL2_AEGTA